MFVGYADDHAGDEYRFMNIQTKRNIMSRDARWLSQFWKHHEKKHNHPRRQQVELFLDEEENPSQEGNELEENRLEDYGNNTPEQRKLALDIGMIGAREETLGRTILSPRNESMERADLTMEEWIQETCLISSVTSGPTEPKTFQRGMS